MFITLNCSPCSRNVRAHKVMVLGLISGVTSYRPPQSQCRVGNKLHSISGPFKVCLGWLINAYFSHSLHRDEWLFDIKRLALYSPPLNFCTSCRLLNIVGYIYFRVGLVSRMMPVLGLAHVGLGVTMIHFSSFPTLLQVSNFWIRPMPMMWWAMFKIEVFNAFQTRFGPSKYTSLRTTLRNVIPNWIQCKNQNLSHLQIYNSSVETSLSIIPSYTWFLFFIGFLINGFTSQSIITSYTHFFCFIESRIITYPCNSFLIEVYIF